MAEPIGYTVSYSFAGFQALNPDRPLPAASLDVELANVEASIASFVAALGDLRRSDGALENGIVGLDALDPQVLAILGPGGEVTVFDLEPSAFAQQAEAEGGAANDKLMTPLRVKQAMDALRAFASQPQAEAGVVSTTVLSPLRGKNMLDALRGFADQATAEAGASATTVLSPLGGKQLLDAVRKAFTATSDLTWGSIAAGASATQDITVTGAAVGDRVCIGQTAAGVQAGIIPVAWVVSTDTVRLRMENTTAGALTPPAGDYAVTALRF